MKTLIAAAALIVALGCDSKYNITADTSGITPAGVSIITNGYAVDFARIDAEWQKAKECNGYDGPFLPTVEIVAPVECLSGECFPCKWSDTGFCAGLAVPAYFEVFVTPNLAALGHELSHLACYAQKSASGDDTTNCENYAKKCGL